MCFLEFWSFAYIGSPAFRFGFIVYCFLCFNLILLILTVIKRPEFKENDEILSTFLMISKNSFKIFFCYFVIKNLTWFFRAKNFLKNFVEDVWCHRFVDLKKADVGYCGHGVDREQEFILKKLLRKNIRDFWILWEKLKFFEIFDFSFIVVWKKRCWKI